MPKYQFSIGVIILAILLVPVVTYAAFDDVSLTTDTVITLGSINLNVSGSGATLESIIVNTGYFAVSLAGTSTITVTSNDRYKLVTTANPGYVTSSCTASASTLTIAVPGSSLNSGLSFDITPDSSQYCSSASTNGGGTSSSGGGAPYVAPVTTPVAKPPVTICPTGLICTPNKVITLPTQASPQAVAAISKVFTKRLTQGSSSNDVRRLQTLLASDPSIYPEGQVTGYFGKLTLKAVQNFQIKYKIAAPGDEGFGTVGPLTRASLQKVFGK